MSDTQVIAPRGASALIRNEPVQARSTARLAALLDAAAQVIDEIGYERLTTAMVAERAGASIGTVYRYFPDRIAVLQSLAARNFERVGDQAVAIIASSEADGWREALAEVFAAIVDAFRSEPGYASLRLGDVIDLRPAEGAPANSVLADRMFDALVERYGVTDGTDARLAFSAAFEASDALLARAFSRDASGDAGYLDKSREVMQALLAPHFA
jgi:AcrR family transcriptional regulator